MFEVTGAFTMDSCRTVTNYTNVCRS